MGISRDEKTLHHAAKWVAEEKRQISSLKDTTAFLDENILLSKQYLLAEAMLLCARARKESRGAHVRTDYPKEETAFATSSVVSFQKDEIQVRFEGKCGACAMVINGIPALACTVFLKDIQRRGKITLEPLHKFPLIRDLKVDRQCIFDALKKRKVWLEKKKTSDFLWDYQLQYQSSKCLMCGCCLEACPNFSPGHTFEGAPLMVHLYKEIEQNEEGTHKTEMKEAYRKHFFRGCGNAMACKNVCPAKIALDDIQARINHYQEG